MYAISPSISLTNKFVSFENISFFEILLTLLNSSGSNINSFSALDSQNLKNASYVPDVFDTFVTLSNNDAIKKYGIIDGHRKTFKPVCYYLNKINKSKRY